MGGDRFWTRESVVTYRLNRTFRVIGHYVLLEG